MWGGRRKRRWAFDISGPIVPLVPRGSIHGSAGRGPAAAVRGPRLRRRLRHRARPPWWQPPLDWVGRDGPFVRHGAMGCPRHVHRLSVRAPEAAKIRPPALTTTARAGGVLARRTAAGAHAGEEQAGGPGEMVAMVGRARRPSTGDEDGGAMDDVDIDEQASRWPDTFEPERWGSERRRRRRVVVAGCTGLALLVLVAAPAIYFHIEGAAPKLLSLPVGRGGAVGPVNGTWAVAPPSEVQYRVAEESFSASTTRPWGRRTTCGGRSPSRAPPLPQPSSLWTWRRSAAVPPVATCSSET